MSENLRARRRALLSAAALVAAALSPLAAASPAQAAGITVQGTVTGSDEAGAGGVGVRLAACPKKPGEAGFKIADCTRDTGGLNWWTESDGKFQLTSFPSGQYLVAGDLDDQYADYEPGLVAAAPITASASGLTATLTARPEVSGLTAELSPRQAIAGQQVELVLTGVPAGAVVEYQWPGDVDEDEDFVQDHVGEATYNVPESEVGNDFYAAAWVLKSGFRRTSAGSSSAYKVWASANEGGHLVGTITDPGQKIESAEDIDLSVCDDSGTGIGVAGSNSYKVVDNGDHTFSYDVVLPNGTYCLQAVINYDGGQRHLLASSTRPQWDDVTLSGGFPAAEKFQITGGSVTTVNLAFAVAAPTPELVLDQQPTWSPASPVAGTPVAITKEPTFEGGVVPDSVSYTWVVVDPTSQTTVGNGGSYVPTADRVGRTLRVEVFANKNGYQTYSGSWTIGTIAAAPGGGPAVVPPPAGTPTPISVPPTAPKAAPKAGKKVKVSPPVVAVPGATVSYQWYANGKKVKKATKPNLKVAPGLKRKKLSVQVTVSAPGYAPVTQVVKVGKVG